MGEGAATEKIANRVALASTAAEREHPAEKIGQRDDYDLADQVGGRDPEPLSTLVPMPPMLSSEALVIWMLRIAKNEPIMAAMMAIHRGAGAVGLGGWRRSGLRWSGKRRIGLRLQDWS